MEQFKRAQIIILPTKNETYIGKHLGDEVYLSLYTWYLKTLNIPNERQGQHLYIISDDEIKESDWFINLFNNVVVQAHNWIHVSTCKKIIATTDTSLELKCDGKCAKYECVCLYPQPSQQFIEKYIKSYNKGEIITDVLVEYENNGFLGINKKEGLKVNPKNNTIIIKKLKNSWNREEVVELLKSFKNDIKKSINSDDSNNWIKENL